MEIIKDAETSSYSEGQREEYISSTNIHIRYK